MSRLRRGTFLRQVRSRELQARFDPQTVAHARNRALAHVVLELAHDVNGDGHLQLLAALGGAAT